ncbi:MAG: AAA family ATPase [Beduini sp.]
MIFKTKNTATLITRPRRFGKTINLSMMHHFLI